MNTRDLAVHLQNHWAAATAGVDFAGRVAGNHRGSAVGTELDGISAEIEQDRQSLREIMVGLGVRPGVILPLAARASERVGRLKPNGHLVRRSPVSDVLELEALRAAVTAKGAGWDTMLALAEQDERLPRDLLSTLLDRAHAQERTLARVQREVASGAAGS